MPGPEGPQGPAGEPGTFLVQQVTVNGPAPDPQNIHQGGPGPAQWMFIAPTVQVPYNEAAKRYVHVSSSRLLGSTVGAANLNLALCVELARSEFRPFPIAGPMLGNAVPAGTRVTMGLSGVYGPITEGDGYKFGLCARVMDDEHAWNWNGDGSTTVQVYEKP